MRRIVFGLLLVALGLWAWSSWRGGDAEAGTGSRPHADLSAILAGDGGGDPRVGPRGPAVTPPAGDPAGVPTADAAMEAAFAELTRQVEAGDAAARQQALRLLGRADLRADHRQQLSQLLDRTMSDVAGSGAVSGATATPEAAASGPSGDRFDPSGLDDVTAVLDRLGSNNDFLHSTEGLGLGRRALSLWKELGLERDAEAVQLGTALLERCMRGPIERSDRAAIAFVDEVYAAYRVRAERVLCDPANLAGARSCEVQKGDSLAKIAVRFRKEGIAMEAGTLAVLNRIHNMNAIQVGQKIRCPIDPVHAVVERRSFLMAVYVGDRILRLYWVGHGADSKTPVTTFTVSEKLENPDWYAPDGQIHPFGSPGNILGRFFLKFDHPSYTGFGAHGTPQPETIGTMASMGCIRMLDGDIEELFRLLPRQAAVEVRDSH